jgi:ribosomal-protein-alanine N-acetyltransferase
MTTPGRAMPGGDDPDESAGDPLEGVVVRRATRADLLDVFRIEKAVFEQPWPFAAFERVLEAPAFLVADASEAGVPVDDDGVGAGDTLGYVVGDVTPNHGRDIGHVKDIAVRPGAQGLGLGRRLLCESLRGLAATGAAVVKLEVRESNHRAQSLYADEGFEPARRIPRYYADGEPAFVMALDLDEWLAG